jgi:hypothetical protein
VKPKPLVDARVIEPGMMQAGDQVKIISLGKTFWLISLLVITVMVMAVCQRYPRVRFGECWGRTDHVSDDFLC